MEDIEINLTGKLNENPYRMPWSSDGICFNFIKPKTVYKADKEFDLCKLGNPENIRSLVISTDLKNFDYIAEMTELEQLYIYHGWNVRNVDFLENLVKLKHLCILRSSVTSLTGLEKMLKAKRECYENSKCDSDAGRNFGVEGIYIHSLRNLKAFNLDDSGVPIVELSLYCRRRTLHWS